MAAHEIKTTLAVDGEQAFKRSLNDAKQSIRNFGTQLTLAQAEFKKTGDAQKLMETRAKALKSEIDQQNEIVKALEKAVDEAGKKYGEGSKEAEKWQAELNRAKATMANLEQELNNNAQGLDRNGKAFDDASGKAEDFKDAVNGIGRGVSFELISSGIGSITKGFEGALKKAVDLGQQMWNMMRDAASWADDEITLAQVYGVSTEDLQRMQHAAKLVDTDVDTVIKARQKLAQAMGKELNSKDIQEAFQALRTPVYDDTTGKMRDLENVFWDAGAAIMALPDEVEQNNVAMKLFGKSWMELKPLFLAGRQAYQDAMDSATVVPQENLERLGALQNQLDALDTEFQALKMNVLSELAPAFETLAGAITDLMAEFNTYLQSDEGKQMMEKLREALDQFFSGIKDIDFTSAVNTVTDALNGLQGAFNWIIDNKDGLKTALGVIAAGFVGLKVATVGINIAKIVEGMNNLLGIGGKGGTPTATPTTAPTTTATNGGFWVGVGNTLQKAASGAAKVISSSGMLPAVMTDMLLNQTEGGRVLRDGGSITEAAQASAKAVKEYTEKTFGEQNLEDFKKNWDINNKDANPIARTAGFFVNGWIENGRNNINYYKQIHDWMKGAEEYAEEMQEILGAPSKSEPTSEWVFGDDWSAEELMQWVQEHGNGGMLPGGVTDGVSGTLYAGTGGGTSGGDDKESLTSKDVAEFGKVPAEIRREIRSAVSGWTVKIDGATAGAVIAPFVDAYMAREATD